MPLVVLLMLLFTACTTHPAAEDDDMPLPDQGDAEQADDTVPVWDDVGPDNWRDRDILPDIDPACGDKIYNGGMLISATSWPDLFSGYTYAGSVEITGLPPGIDDLSDLSSLRCIGYGLWIRYNNDLISLKGLDNLIQMGADLNIEGNDKLTDISALGNLKEINGKISIISNYSLKSTYGLHNIETSGLMDDREIVISDNPLLEELRFDRLKKVRGIYIYESGLTSFGNLGSLESIGIPENPEGVGIVCVECNSMTTVDGLGPQLTTIDGDLGVGSVALTNIEGYGHITRINGVLGVAKSKVLTSLHGIEQITYIGGLSINLTEILDDITALGGLAEIGGKVSIWSNKALSTLAGLHNITKIAGPMSITGNSALKDITALYQLTSVGKAEKGADIVIKDNPKLPQCMVDTLIAGLKAKGWTGTTETTGNDPAGTCE